jgi:hypothetical protein
VEAGGNGCPVIDGDYRNAGEMSHEVYADHYVQEDISLVQLLYGWADQGDQRLDFTALEPGTDPHESVSLQVGGDALRVRATESDGSVSTFDIPAAIHCEDSLMHVDAVWDAETFLIASSIDRSSLAFGRGDDGSLLVKANSAAGYFLFYWPMGGGKDERWLRFAAIDPVLADAGVASAEIAP